MAGGRGCAGEAAQAKQYRAQVSNQILCCSPPPMRSSAATRDDEHTSLELELNNSVTWEPRRAGSVKKYSRLLVFGVFRWSVLEG